MLEDDETREKMFRVPGTFMPRHDTILYLLGMDQDVTDNLVKKMEKTNVTEAQHVGFEMAGQEDTFDPMDLKVVHKTADGMVLGTVLVALTESREMGDDENNIPHGCNCPMKRVYVSVPVVIAPFRSFLDASHLSWKSVSGKKDSTLRLFGDREGIHTGVLQALDKVIELGTDSKLPQPIKMKMIVVNDEDNMTMSDVKDIVKCTVPEIPEMIASRLRGMPWKYCN